MAKDSCVCHINRLHSDMIKDFPKDSYPSICELTYLECALMNSLDNSYFELSELVEVATAQIMDEEFRQICETLPHFGLVWQCFISRYGDKSIDLSTTDGRYRENNPEIFEVLDIIPSLPLPRINVGKM